MVTERFKEWVAETKVMVSDAHDPCISAIPGMWWYITRVLVYALLTIAIAIHEAAERKK